MEKEKKLTVVEPNTTGIQEYFKTVQLNYYFTINLFVFRKWIFRRKICLPQKCEAHDYPGFLQ